MAGNDNSQPRGPAPQPQPERVPESSPSASPVPVSGGVSRPDYAGAGRKMEAAAEPAAAALRPEVSAPVRELKPKEIPDAEPSGGRRSLWRHGLLVSLFGLLAAGAIMIEGWDRPAPTPEPPDFVMADAIVPRKFVVVFESGVTAEVIREIEAKHGVTLSRNSKAGETWVGEVNDPATELKPLLEELNKHPEVRTAEHQIIYNFDAAPNDPLYPEQWNFHGIKVEQAWDLGATGEGVVVAVLDSGVMIQTGPGSIILPDLARTKVVAGYDFLEDDTVPQDDHGHGSHVAGTIAQSTNNGEGVAGIAYNASIMPLRVGARNITNEDIADAIRWATDQGADVINMSLGGPMPSHLIEDAIDYATAEGVLVITAAGNDSGPVSYPAACRNSMAISATTVDNELAGYSNRGPQIDLAAPGGGQPGGVFKGLIGMVTGNDRRIVQETIVGGGGGGAVMTGYQAFQGTSMACPHVAGVAALLHEMGVTDPGEKRSILKKSAQKVNGPTDHFGAGILNAGAAVSMARRKTGVGFLHNGVFALACVGTVFGALTTKTGAAAGFFRRHAGKVLPFAIGMLFPSLLGMLVGADSFLNLLGHSVLVPWLWTTFGNGKGGSLRLLTWFSAGLILHLLIDVQARTSPFPVLQGWKIQLWLVANIVAAGYVLHKAGAFKEKREGRAEPVRAPSSGPIPNAI